MYGVATGDEIVARASSSTRFVTTLLVGFGVGAVLLATLGVYGVLAYLVSQRRREFGVRMAIGAQPSSLLALVVRQGMVLTVAGLVVGVLGAHRGDAVAFRLSVRRRALRSRSTYGAIATVVGAAGILAAFIPARRATRVDPVIALRE